MSAEADAIEKTIEIIWRALCSRDGLKRRPFVDRVRNEPDYRRLVVSLHREGWNDETLGLYLIAVGEAPERAAEIETVIRLGGDEDAVMLLVKGSP